MGGSKWRTGDCCDRHSGPDWEENYDRLYKEGIPKHCHKLNLHDNTVTDWPQRQRRLARLARDLEKNTKLITLGITKNHVGRLVTKALARALEKNIRLTTLHLKDNDIDDVGAMALASALEKNNILKELDLSMNRIGNKGAMALAKAR